MQARRTSSNAWLRLGEKGFALYATFLVLVLFLSLGVTSITYSMLETQTTSHFKTGNQALAAAESGIFHALSTMNGMGVVDFQRDVVDRWPQLYSPAVQAIQGFSTVTYEAVPVSDSTVPADAGSVTCTGRAALLAERVVRVRLAKGGFLGSPGTIYLPSTQIQSNFVGNAFEIDGNDHDMYGDLTNSGIVKPGIATQVDSVTQAIASSLSSSQKDNVTGTGFSTNPLTPSIQTTGGPSADDLRQFVSDILARPGVITVGGGTIGGNQLFGTTTSPQITHMTASTVRLTGTAAGAGVLIVDGSLEISGTLDFVGWVIVLGDTTVSSASSTGTVGLMGSTTILGSLWTAKLDIQVGGTATVNYCDACLRLADTTGGVGGGNLPRMMKVSAWQEVNS